MGTKKPDFEHEENLWKKGYHVVIGVDEVGRGAFAGPLIAAAVSIYLQKKTSSQSYRVDWEEIGIDDSKRLSPAKREELTKIIKKQAKWGIGEASVAYVNVHGIVKATEKAMRSSIANLKFKIKNSKLHETKSFVLVDAFYIRYVKNIGLKNQRAIVKGDQKSISIAAASIIAKVYRDKLMARLHHKGDRGNRVYRWDKNKGYGTREHRKAIRLYGATKHHRKGWVHHNAKWQMTNAK